MIATQIIMLSQPAEAVTEADIEGVPGLHTSDPGGWTSVPLRYAQRYGHASSQLRAVDGPTTPVG